MRQPGYYWVLFETGSPLPDGSIPRVWTIGELVSSEEPITLYVIGWDAPVGEPIEWGPRIEVPIGYVTGQL